MGIVLPMTVLFTVATVPGTVGAMGELIYRVVCACAGLGYGFPKASMDIALQGRVDAIIADAGSMDAGPYYLGSGRQYMEREAVKADFTLMVQAAQEAGAPIVIGTSGMAGGARNLQWMVDVAKEVFAEQQVNGWQVALIESQLDSRVVLEQRRAGHVVALGDMPDVADDDLLNSVIVGQMGIAPLITALDEGADCVLAGRACDVALFASDMIRRGIDPGLAYHVGHVLECGALACDPGSASDCLVAEVYDDGTAVFVAPDPARACRPYSIAAHSLYEESHPELQSYPEGVLCMHDTEYFAVGDRTAGIRDSVFVRAADLSIKLEGARRVGARRVSLVSFDAAELAAVPDDVLVYGRNGVEPVNVAVADEHEIGLLIETRADQQSDATLLASLWAHFLLHYGYPARKATAGNVAYPLSPNLIEFTRADGSAGAVVVQGTRDPVFQENFESIRAGVEGRIASEFPDALRRATARLVVADAEHPIALVRTVADDDLAALHDADLEWLAEYVTVGEDSLLRMTAEDLYEWTVYHRLTDRDVIVDQMFPIAMFDATGADWTLDREIRPKQVEVGVTDYAGDIDERTLSAIGDTPPAGQSVGSVRLRDIAKVVRSKNAGINRLTYDILFTTADDFRTALRSNVFAPSNVLTMLPVDAEGLIGVYRVDTCNAIKITIDGPIVSASAGERDVFGAQQQAGFILMDVPVYAAS
jgi:hypothetical protein